MKKWIVWFLMGSALFARADTLRVGSGEAYGTIQSAISAATAGDTVEVGPGLYAENVVLSKALVLKGAKASVDGRTRSGSAPDPLLETVIQPASGRALEIAVNGSPLVVDGFSLAGAVNGADGVVAITGAGADGLQFRNNVVRVDAAASGAAMWLASSAEDVTIERNALHASALSTLTVYLDGADEFHGLQFLDNQVTRSGGVSGTGLLVDGDRNVGRSPGRVPRIAGNRFSGHALGLDGGSRSLLGVEIENNVFEGNTGGMAAGPKDSWISGNTWNSNSRFGLRLTAFGANADASKGAQSTMIVDNVFSNNGTVADAGGQGDVILDDQADGTFATLQIRRNRFTSATGFFCNETSGSIDATFNYWGHASGPGGVAAGSGAAITPGLAVSFAPFYQDVAFTTFDFGATAFQGTLALASGQAVKGGNLILGTNAELTVARGASVEVGNLSLQADARIEVNGGALKLGELSLTPGAVLDVVNGELSLDPLGAGEFHTIAGSFTFFNCLGSIHINEDTTFSGATLGIVSDIHVESGVTMTVSGALALDGCTLEGSGYTLQVNPGATFSLKRSEITGATLQVNGNDTVVSDNTFRSSPVVVGAAVNGARIYHNVFEDGLAALDIQSGAVVTTQVEGWGNVVTPGEVKNSLALQLAPSLAPGRTLTADGRLFIQPGDALAATLELSKLQAKAQGVESVLGFSTDFLTLSTAQTAGDWTEVLYQLTDETSTIGRLNSAAGLNIEFPDRDGTDQDGAVMDLAFHAKMLEGQTRLFFRAKDVVDHALIDTRITAGGSAPFAWEAPFTRNSATITVDGTAPVIAPLVTVEQNQAAGLVDLLPSGVMAHQGTVGVVVDVRDTLAGIDSEDLRVVFTGTTGSSDGVILSQQPVVHGSEEFTRYTVEWQVTPATPNGAYNVDVAVLDRSGNAANLAVGAIEVQKNQIAVSIALQGVSIPAVQRDVEFVATGTGGAVLASWTIPVSFTAGTGTATLFEVPEGTLALSAKSAWTLRRRINAALDSQGQAVAVFTGVAALSGGDLNGDNVVNLLDYQILSTSYLTVSSAADISGDGVVNLTDYSLQSANWFAVGDPL